MNIKKPSFCLILALYFSLFTNQLPIIMAQTNNVSFEELKTLLAAMQGDSARAGKISANLKPQFDAFAKLPETAKNLAVEAAKDLDQILADIPDSSLAADWAYFNNEIRQDLLMSPEQTLTDLNNLRRRILKTGNARMFVIGLRDTQQKLDTNIRSLIAGLENAPATKAIYSNARLIDERLKTGSAKRTRPFLSV